MTDLAHVETLLQDAIALLTDSGFPLAADALRDNLRAIREAPTAGARRHRIFQLRDLFDGMGSASDVFFWAPSEGTQRLALHPDRSAPPGRAALPSHARVDPGDLGDRSGRIGDNPRPEASSCPAESRGVNS